MVVEEGEEDVLVGVCGVGFGGEVGGVGGVAGGEVVGGEVVGEVLEGGCELMI